MKKFRTILLMGTCFINFVYAEGYKTIEGHIVDFICGDNCYLTIVDKKGEKHSALCHDYLCRKMEEGKANPYNGRKVKVTVGEGKQVDGEGEAMDTMKAFTQIQLIK